MLAQEISSFASIAMVQQQGISCSSAVRYSCCTALEQPWTCTFSAPSWLVLALVTARGMIEKHQTLASAPSRTEVSVHHGHLTGEHDHHIEELGRMKKYLLMVTGKAGRHHKQMSGTLVAHWRSNLLLQYSMLHHP